VKRIATVAVAVAALTAALAVTVLTDAATTDPSWCTSHDRVAILGTSADTGYGTTGYPSTTETYAPTAYGWTAKMSQNLTAQWGTTTANYSHNGAMASDYLPGGRWSTTAALADIASTKPNLIIIDLGSNEFWPPSRPRHLQRQPHHPRQQRENQRARREHPPVLLPRLKWTPNPSPSTQTHTDAGSLIEYGGYWGWTSAIASVC
jgi:hypothetical protein